MDDLTFTFTGKLWRWQGDAPAAWHFITLPVELGGQIKFFSGRKQGFGSVRVIACTGAARWKTSLFPDKTSGSYLLPVKADVRKAEKLQAGQDVPVRLVLDV
jgi:Domain of unknown function (DUF1905)